MQPPQNAKLELVLKLCAEQRGTGMLCPGNGNYRAPRISPGHIHPRAGSDPPSRPAGSTRAPGSAGEGGISGGEEKAEKSRTRLPNTGGNTAALTPMTLEAFILRSPQTYFQLPCSASPPLSLQTLKYIVPFCLTMAACSSFSLVSISHDSLACK